MRYVAILSSFKTPQISQNFIYLTTMLNCIVSRMFSQTADAIC